MDNKEQRNEGETSAYTKDVQQANLKYVVNFYLKPDASAAILSSVGYNYKEVLIPQAVLGGIKNVIGKWNAIELISNRKQATEEITQSVSIALEKHGIIISRFELTDIGYQPTFEEAVEAKVTAVQRAEEAKNNTVRIREEAEQRIIAAKADAEAMSIKTEALSKSQSLIAYEAIQKWDGILPKIISGDSGNLLNIPETTLK